MAERSDGYDGNYKQDVEHYAVLADRVDQQLTNFHGAGTATPDCLGNVVRVGDLLDAHTARPAVYTPKANAVVTKADVVNAIVEDPQYDTTSEHEQFLEVLADDHLERNHSTVELPEAPDPDDRYPEQGSVRVTSGLQSDLTNTVPDVSPSRAEALPKLLSPLTDACVEAVEAIADDERRPIASLLSTPEPDAKTVSTTSRTSTALTPGTDRSAPRSLTPRATTTSRRISARSFRSTERGKVSKTRTSTRSGAATARSSERAV